MASFYVVTPPDMTNPEKQTVFIRDGFSWPAFLLPLPWLLVRKLWLIAGLSVVLYLLSVAAAEYWGLDGLPIAYSVILCLWAGLEGGHVRATWLQRKGWDLKATITAATIDDAEAIYFDDMPGTITVAPAHNFSGRPGSPSTNVAALGLIGPYGSR